ncbi:MAG: carbohydrate ABC transporter permease [Pseudomonadota bacterium]
MAIFKNKSPGSWLITCVMYLLALSWLYPYLWMLMASLKPTTEIYTASLFGGTLSLDNFGFLFDSAERIERPFLRALLNSVLVTVVVTASVLVTSVYAAFAIVKLKCRGHKQLTEFLIFQMVWPTMLLTLPLFILMRQLGLLNSYAAIVLPSMVSGWGIFMISQAFKGTPNDYIDAAKLDMASLDQILRNVMVPLNKSVIAIVGLFTFTGMWDNFMWPLVVVSDVSKMPLSVLLATFDKQYGTYLGPVMAGAVLQSLPLIVIFILFRKYFLQGMSLSLK